MTRPYSNFTTVQSRSGQIRHSDHHANSLRSIVPRRPHRVSPNFGLLPNEVPFRCQLGLQEPEFVEACLGLKPARKDVRAARRAIIANIHVCAYAAARNTRVL